MPSDLIPVNISLGSTSVAPGATLSVNWLLWNQGNMAASSSSTTVIRINQSSSSAAGSNLDTEGTAALGAGISVSQSSVLTAPTTPGTYFVWVIADNFSNVTNQSSTSNDLQHSVAFTVTAPPAPTFTISNAGNVVEGNNAVFTVTRNGGISSNVTIYYSTTPGSASASDGDYPFNFVDIPLTFTPSGSATQQISIPTLVEPGNPSEPNQNFNVVLMNSPSGSTVSTGTATILANGTSSTPATFTISNAGNVVEGNNAVFTVTRNGSISSNVTIYYSTTPGSASASDGDYPFNFVDIPLTFTPSGSATQQISIPILVEPGNPSEPNQNFNVVLMNSPSGSTVSTGTATILANGTSSTPATFTISNAGNVVEGNNAVFTVTMSGSISAPVTIYYTTLIGTASAADGDYPLNLVDIPLTFNPGGSPTRQISIPILVEPGNPSEPNQSFSVGLRNTIGGSIFVSGTATILANATPPLADDYADEATDTTASIGSINVGSSRPGIIGSADANDNQYGDKDVFAVTLQAGKTYTFEVNGSNGLADAIFTLRDSNFNTVLEQSNQGDPASLRYDIKTTGTYYVRVGTAIIGQQGEYTLSVVESGVAPTDDYADEPSEVGTTNGIGNLVGSSISGVIGPADANDNQYGDKDVFAVTLQAGKKYKFEVNGSNGLTDGLFSLRDSNFNTVLRESNQGDPASLTYDIQTTGKYYVHVGTAIIGQQGEYTLTVADVSEAPPANPSARTDILRPASRPVSICIQRSCSFRIGDHIRIARFGQKGH